MSWDPTVKKEPVPCQDYWAIDRSSAITDSSGRAVPIKICGTDPEGERDVRVPCIAS
jgi:hypothetical protein